MYVSFYAFSKIKRQFFYMKIILFLIICILVGFIIHKIRSLFKFPVISCMSLTTGAVKSGKTTFTVAQLLSFYKRNLRRVKRVNFFCKLFKRELLEIPLIYSNIPLSCEYVPLTKDLIYRKKRFRYGSVIYVNEASLLANSQEFKDMELNERLLFFNKLIGHELKGGYLLYDTQCIADVHFNIKRCISEYFYIHHTVKWIPFFLVSYVVEQRYSYDGSIISAETTDIDERLKRVIIPKRVWKKFDAYSFSILTDNLPVEDTIVKTKNLKTDYILSFNDFKTINNFDNVNKKELIEL